MENIGAYIVEYYVWWNYHYKVAKDPSRELLFSFEDWISWVSILTWPDYGTYHVRHGKHGKAGFQYRKSYYLGWLTSG